MIRRKLRNGKLKRLNTGIAEQLEDMAKKVEALRVPLKAHNPGDPVIDEAFNDFGHSMRKLRAVVRSRMENMTAKKQ